MPAILSHVASQGIGAKAAWRERILAGRAASGTLARARAASALVEALLPGAVGPVAAYASIGTEPPTGPLLHALAARGPVLLPVLRGDGELDWAPYESDRPLVRAGRGLLQSAAEPLGPDAVAECALVVVPALAVDRRGVRLGRGAGCYDRALARATGTVVAALYDGELVGRLPHEPHDRPVHAVVLPSRGLVRLRGAGLPGDGGRPGAS